MVPGLRYGGDVRMRSPSKEEAMSHKTISRRDALGVLGKTGAMLGAGTVFFLSLRTTPLGASDERQTNAPRLKASPRSAEKVLISGSGSILTVRVYGPPGRHFAVSYATTDARENYRAAENAHGYIGENGTAAVKMDVKSLPNGKVFLRVVTGATSGFDQDIKGTQAFEVTITGGVVTNFGGIRQRPLEGASAAATVAAAGYNSKIR
jgi:hypothetical protein